MWLLNWCRGNFPICNPETIIVNYTSTHQSINCWPKYPELTIYRYTRLIYRHFISKKHLPSSGIQLNSVVEKDASVLNSNWGAFFLIWMLSRLCCECCLHTVLAAIVALRRIYGNIRSMFSGINSILPPTLPPPSNWKDASWSKPVAHTRWTWRHCHVRLSVKKNRGVKLHSVFELFSFHDLHTKDKSPQARTTARVRSPTVLAGTGKTTIYQGPREPCTWWVQLQHSAH